MVSTLTIGPIPRATAQVSKCPAGFECTGDSPDYCLPRESLREHQTRLEECQSARDSLRGRLEEARDAEAAAKARIEGLVSIRDIWKRRAEERQRRLEQWWHREWVWIGALIAIGVGGYTAGSLAPPSMLR